MISLTPEEKLWETIREIKFSGLIARETIKHPVKDQGKFDRYCMALYNAYLLTEEYQGKLDADDPDTPYDCHIITVIFPTDETDITVDTLKDTLTETINYADDINLLVLKDCTLHVSFSFENIYTPRETN